MESSGDKFVDHKETIMNAPRPGQMSASKVDILATEGSHVAKISEKGAGSTQMEVQVLMPKMEILLPDSQNVGDAFNTKPDKSACLNKETSSSDKGKSVKMMEQSLTEHKVPVTTTVVTTYATTVYTQRISGRSSRSSRSSDSGSDASSPQAKSPNNTPEFGSIKIDSPKEICSVQFNVEAGVTSNTTTAFSKIFSKTVETPTEVKSAKTHVSEYSFSVGRSPSNAQETDTNHGMDETFTGAEESLHNDKKNQEDKTDDNVFAENISMKFEGEKEVSEYCPGLAIRTLTLEDLQEKRLSPERETKVNDIQQTAADMSTTVVPAQSSTLIQETGNKSLGLNSECNNMSHPINKSSDKIMSTEQKMAQIPAPQACTYTSSPMQGSLTAVGQLLMQCTEESTPQRKPLFNPTEVERKFTITENTEEQLKSFGARLHKEKTFSDIYYDNNDYDLIIRDCWLRRRNDTWEAKVPLTSQNTEAVFAPASQFKIINNEREISTWLVNQLGLESWMKGDPIDLLVQASGLTGFAKLMTTRRSYTLPFCMVSLDFTDHGFQVGEIEVMAASPEEVPQALHTIDGLAQQLALMKDGRQNPYQHVLCVLYIICESIIISLLPWNRLYQYLYSTWTSIT